MRKGQAEIVVVLGILIVVAIAVFLAVMGGRIIPSAVPEGIYKQQREVAASVGNVIRDATDKTLKDMMTHGGYLGARVPGVARACNDVPNVGFLLSDVPYWQRCEEAMYPDLAEVKSSMESSIEDMVRKGMGDIESQYGNRAVFDKSRIDVVVDIRGTEPFEPDSIGVTVRMPTEVRNYTLPEGDLHPYRIELDTKFGRIYSFGKDFAEASAENRYFDVFSIAAIYFSQELENTHTKLPTAGVMTQCGEVVYRSPQQINAYLLEVLEYVMSSTEWWKEMQPESSGTKSFAIGDLDGKRYTELDVSTKLADNWVFELMDHVFATNFRMPEHRGFVVPVCTQSYNHAYDFSYPFIVRVKDPYTGYVFSFASEVSVKENSNHVMEPGECGAAGSAPSGCESLPCQGSVSVKDSRGIPIGGAWVVFGGCPLGETGAEGLVEGPIKCGAQELFVYSTSDYEFLRRDVSSEALRDRHEVTLNPMREVRVHFFKVGMQLDGYRTGKDDEQMPASCAACASSCDMDTSATQSCNIEPVAREQVLLEFDNGYMKLPVTNVDPSGAAGCSDTADCLTCSEHAEELEAGRDVGDSVMEACRRCAQGCYSPLLTSTVVDYLPSGYEYSVEGIMFDPLQDYFITGALKGSFTLTENVTDVYVYMPQRGRSGVSPVEESEKSCLRSALAKCGIDTLSIEKHVTTVALLPSDYECLYLRGYIEACGGTAGFGTFCSCPLGGSYPGSCDKSCGKGDDPVCSVCCDLERALERMQELEESCGLRVVAVGQ